MGYDAWDKSKKKLRIITDTKIMFWYKWLEQCSPVPGKGVGSGGKNIQTNSFFRRGPISTTSPVTVGRLASLSQAEQ